MRIPCHGWLTAADVDFLGGVAGGDRRVLALEACSFYEDGIGSTRKCVWSPDEAVSAQGWAVGVNCHPVAFDFLLQDSAFHVLHQVREDIHEVDFPAQLIRVPAGNAPFCWRVNGWLRNGVRRERGSSPSEAVSL